MRPLVKFLRLLQNLRICCCLPYIIETAKYYVIQSFLKLQGLPTFNMTDEGSFLVLSIFIGSYNFQGRQGLDVTNQKTSGSTLFCSHLSFYFLGAKTKM